MDLTGKTIVITGSTDGVGRRMAERLAKDGARLILHGRNRARGEALLKEIKAGGTGDATLHLADFASLADVRSFADAVKKDGPRIDVLINNAGIGFVPDERVLTPDGNELRFAVNYLSGFLLTHLLLDRLVASAPARIVNVSSIGQSPIDLDDVNMARTWQDGRVAYTQSKLAQVMLMLDLAEALKSKGVTVTALHPATYMNTGMVTSAGITPLTTVDQGADAILALAVGPQHAATTGKFFNGLAEARANAQAYDAAARQKLDGISRKLTGIAA